MSIRLVTPDMICHNCFHYGGYGSPRSVSDVCGVLNLITGAKDPYCNYFQGGDLSHSKTKNISLYDTGSRYQTIRSKRRIYRWQKQKNPH